jgi:hypothetical protein
MKKCYDFINLSQWYFSMIYAYDFNTFNYVKEMIWWCLWVLRYAYEYVDWVMFYVLYEKLRIHVVFESLKKACNGMSCISVKVCTQT